MKQIWKVLIGVLGLTLLIVLVSIARKKHKDVVCSLLSIHIDYQNTDHLITALEVREKVYAEFDTLEGKPIKEIDLIALEKLIADIPVVEESSISSQISGDIIIKIKQRKPIARFIDKKGISYYLDQKGYGFKVKPPYVSHQTVINGNIKGVSENISLFEIDTLDNSVLMEAYTAVKYVNNNEFWKSQLVQFYYNSNKEYEVSPRIGEFTILFRTLEDLPEKLYHLSAFFEQGLNMVGWDKYRYINMKFENQIICTKR